MKKENQVAFLVLTYNSATTIKDCLDSILAQNLLPNKVFVIDNASTDKTIAIIKKSYPQVTIVSHSQNLGVGKGFNRQIKKIYKSYRYLGLFNADIKLDKAWLQEALKTITSSASVQICASLCLDWEGNKIDSAGGAIVNLLTGVWSGFLSGLPVEEIPASYRQDFPVFFGVVTGMLVRAGAFFNFGFFDEDYFMYFEDIDFSWRVLLGGGKIICNPKAIIYHFGHGSRISKKISLKLLKQTEINLLATYAKNMSWGLLIFLLPCLIITRFLMSLFYLPISVKITWGKISGLSLFFYRLVTGHYQEKRQGVSRNRKLSDYQVLKLNPTSLVSFQPVIKALGSWLRTIGQVYKRGS